MRVLSEAFLCQKENHQSRHSLTVRRHSKFSEPEGYDSLTREKALEDERQLSQIDLNEPKQSSDVEMESVQYNSVFIWKNKKL